VFELPPSGGILHIGSLRGPGAGVNKNLKENLINKSSAAVQDFFQIVIEACPRLMHPANMKNAVRLHVVFLSWRGCRGQQAPDVCEF
jgi:hypothetical protein